MESFIVAAYAEIWLQICLCLDRVCGAPHRFFQYFFASVTSRLHPSPCPQVAAAAAAALQFVGPLPPWHLLAASVFAACRERSTRARDQVAVELHNFMAQPLYLSVLPVFVTLLVFCVMWKLLCGSSPEIPASRTITIGEIDHLMMTYACGCDCGEVTSISNVAVAPSPELSFEALQQPQLMLDSCASVRLCCGVRSLSPSSVLFFFCDVPCLLDKHPCSCSRSPSLPVTCASFWPRATPSFKGRRRVPFARTCCSSLRRVFFWHSAAPCLTYMPFSRVFT